MPTQEAKIERGLREVRATASGGRPAEALQKLRKLRDEAWTSDYGAALEILQRELYQDSTHFLLELLQNADDAKYGDRPEISFRVRSRELEVRYNERGFDIDDVIALTATGRSTKLADKAHAHSFIGEKGIGFKSVFAMATEVELESPPWHFVLRRDRCVVPEQPAKQNGLTPGDGTRLVVRFASADHHALVQQDLEKLCSPSGRESFLFLQKLERLSVRVSGGRTIGIEVERSRKRTARRTIQGIGDDRGVEYAFYESTVEFAARLAKERWPKQAKGIRRPVPRKIIVATRVKGTGPGRGTRQGRLYCYLPTQVRLPVPLVIQVDAQLAANRERLLDPLTNEWNRALLAELPSVIAQAILEWRADDDLAERLPAFVPVDVGFEQLAGVFNRVQRILKSAEWVRTYDGGWARPSRVLRLTPYLAGLFERLPAIRKEAQAALKKEFLHPGWEDSAFESVWSAYDVRTVGVNAFVRLLNGASSVQSVLSCDREFRLLYEEVRRLAQRDGGRGIDSIRKLEIFPFEDGIFGALGPRDEGSEVYWVSSSAQRKTGFEGEGTYRLINPQYTYEASAGGGASEEAKARIKTENERNRLVRKVMEVLEVERLTEETLADGVQVPYLLREPVPLDARAHTQRETVWLRMYESFQAKQKPSETLLRALSRLRHARFASAIGDTRPLGEMTLPGALRIDPIDDAYDSLRLPQLALPGPFAAEAERSDDARRKLREFLIACGLRRLPRFEVENWSAYWEWEFRNDHPTAYQTISAQRRGFSQTYQTLVRGVSLDSLTLDGLPPQPTPEFSDALYAAWRDYVTELHPDHPRPGDVVVRYAPAYARGHEGPRYFPAGNWAGLDAAEVPVRTIAGVVRPAGGLRAITVPHGARLTALRTLVPLVDTAQYEQSFLDSLGIPPLRPNDLNACWQAVPDEEADALLEAYCEALEANMPPDGILIRDRTSDALRPVTDFRLGTPGESEASLLDAQYGKAGLRLGRLLELAVGGETERFHDLADRLEQVDDGTAAALASEVEDLLVRWERWSPAEQAEVFTQFQNFFFGPARFLVLDQEGGAERLRAQSVWAIGLRVPAGGRNAMLRAGRKLGFRFAVEDARPRAKGRPITQHEAAEVRALLMQYAGLLDEHERARLQAVLPFELGVDPRPNLRRATTIVLELGLPDGSAAEFGTAQPPWESPGSDTVLFGSDDTPTTMACWFVVRAGLERAASARGALEQARVAPAPAPQPPQPEQAAEVPPILSPEELAALVNEALVVDPPPVKVNAGRDWRGVGDPDADEEAVGRLAASLRDALSAGPEVFEGKLRQAQSRQRETFVDPKGGDPRAFLVAEYDGICQVHGCGFGLVTPGGRRYFETLRIVEPRGKHWWADRPFNVLCLCPNHHAAMKHGGRDLREIFEVAQAADEHAPEEVPERNGDFFVMDVEVNGEVQRLDMSPGHLLQLRALFDETVGGDG